jgi:hypothetical protein
MKIRVCDVGSVNIIFIDKKVVYKIIPYVKKRKNFKYRFSGDQREVDLYKLLTREFILTNKTPHIVGYYSNYKTSLVSLFTTLPNIKTLYLKKSTDVLQQLAKLRHDYTNGDIKENADVVVLEKCSMTISDYIKPLLKKDPTSILHRVIFQIIFTLAVIQKKYPSFVHNDLFLRNILTRHEKKYKENEYVEYNFNKKKFYFKANGIFAKINDFGFSLAKNSINTFDKNRVNKQLRHMVNINCKKCDVFNFLHDLYDGQNFGGKSMMKLIDGNKKQKSVVTKVFSQYLDTKLIDTINKSNRRLLNKTWSIYNLPFLQNAVQEPADYLKNLKFPLPQNCVVVQVYNKQN